MTTREGGVSTEPWSSLNLGLMSGDEPGQELVNRGLVESAMGVPAVYLKQVHGVKAVAIEAQTPSGLEGDVAWTTQSGIACAMMAADCLPILVCHSKAKWVAAAHAGWRGLAGANGRGVVETLAQGAIEQGFSIQDCMVWLGPCIGPTAFEVGQDVFDAFTSQQQPVLETMRPEAFFLAQDDGKFLADLAGLARWRLTAAGFQVICGNDSSLTWCTYRQESKYHSHRRDAVRKGGSGRMAAYIWITA